VHLYYSFQLCSLAVAWQSVKLERANFLKFRNGIGVFWRTLYDVQGYANVLRTSLFCWFALPSIGDALSF